MIDKDWSYIWIFNYLRKVVTGSVSEVVNDNGEIVNPCISCAWVLNHLKKKRKKK